MSYLLALRLIPLIPFFIVNLVPAFLGVRLRTYVLATFFGIVPGSIVYASVGAGLGSVFDRSEAFSPASILTPQIALALAGLVILALLPVVYRKLKARRAHVSTVKRLRDRDRDSLPDPLDDLACHSEPTRH